MRVGALLIGRYVVPAKSELVEVLGLRGLDQTRETGDVYRVGNDPFGAGLVSPPLLGAS